MGSVYPLSGTRHLPLLLFLGVILTQPDFTRLKSQRTRRSIGPQSWVVLRYWQSKRQCYRQAYLKQEDSRLSNVIKAKLFGDRGGGNGSDGQPARWCEAYVGALLCVLARRKPSQQQQQQLVLSDINVVQGRLWYNCIMVIWFCKGGVSVYLSGDL